MLAATLVVVHGRECYALMHGKRRVRPCAGQEVRVVGVARVPSECDAACERRPRGAERMMRIMVMQVVRIARRQNVRVGEW